MLPSATGPDRSSSPAYLQELVRFVCATRFEDLPGTVVARCKHLIADCFAIITAGNQSAELKALAADLLEHAPSGPCWVIGTSRRCGARDAGFLNGIASTWHDFDEGSTIAYSHPGSQTVPAALAAAQAIGVSGRDLLRAVVLGYEVSARVGRASKMRVAVHPHGVVGVIGSAVAVGLMHGFDEAQMLNLVNIAATMGMATNRQAMLDEATVRNVYSGHSALAGLNAVHLARARFTGQRDGIGYTYGTVIADGFDPERMTAGLGSDWLITQGYFKLHPTGRYSHAAIDALQAAIASTEGPIDIATIERIEVRAFQMAALLSGKRITTSFGAKFSIPFALATILVHGRSGIESFDIEAVEDPRVQSLIAKVDVTEDPAYTRAYPDKQLCDVVIHLDHGRTLRGRCEIMKGEPGNPHKPEAVEQKFYDLTVPVWGDTRADRLYKALLGLEQVHSLRAFGAEFAL
jgi:2-methylcitrate dehydratase PrpD